MITAWTTVLVSDIDRHSLIVIILRRWKTRVLQVLITCFTIGICWSKVRPMFLSSIRSQHIDMYSKEAHGKWRALSINSFDLVSLSLSLLRNVERSVYLTHPFIRASAPSCSFAVGLKARYRIKRGSWSHIPAPFYKNSAFNFSFHIIIPHPVPNCGESRFPGAVKSRLTHLFLVKSRIVRIPVRIPASYYGCGV